MIDPEYYVGAVRGADGAWTTTKYCDAAIDALVAERDMKVPSPRLLLIGSASSLSLRMRLRRNVWASDRASSSCASSKKPASERMRDTCSRRSQSI